MCAMYTVLDDDNECLETVVRNNYSSVANEKRQEVWRVGKQREQGYRKNPKS